MKRYAILAGLIGLAFLPASGTAVAGHPPHTVAVSMKDFKFALSKRAVPHGLAVFKVRNDGKVIHDFKIAGKKTPIYTSGRGGLLRVRIDKAGRYKYVCTVPGHVAAGMWGVLVVR
jgi:uncharacterized cupredoxin-like copper-binding protein